MEQLLSRYTRDLALRGFSPRTQAHYLRSARQFLVFYDLPPDQLDTEKIKDYLYHLLDTQKASDSKIRQAHGSLKYLFTQTLARPWEIESIPQMKKKRTLPSVLSIEEISRLLSSCSNLKHQAMLMLIYSSGLRLSEAVSVQLTDIKRNQKRILIRQGKGAKDRYVILSDLCLNTLERYWRRYRPETFLFPGRNGKALSPRACQHAFHTAKESAGIHKTGGVHTLRHSFATHFLESGGGIFQLQMFLGHRNLKTTLIYAHVQSENIIARSPLDAFEKEFSIDSK